ncbi:hypothetical protein CR513_32053, partial [Mucuna pruriens]
MEGRLERSPQAKHTHVTHRSVGMYQVDTRGWTEHPNFSWEGHMKAKLRTFIDLHPYNIRTWDKERSQAHKIQ